MHKKKKWNRVHAVCEYLRLSRDPKHWDCKRCPAWAPSPYGRVTRMCYRLAKEVINIAKHGHPRGKKATRAQIQQWRARCERHGHPHLRLVK